MIRYKNLFNQIELHASNVFIEKGDITIVVGPNHSGKTLFLKELYDYVSGNRNNQNSKIIKKINIDTYNSEVILNLLKELGYSIENDEQDGITKVLIESNKIELSKDKEVNTQLYKYLIKYLDLHTRFVLLQNVQNISLRSSPQNPLQTIFRNKPLREKIRKKISDATNLIVTTDITEPHTIAIKIARSVPSEDLETSMMEDAILFHNSTKQISEYSEGIKSYIGIILSLFGDRHKIIEIDEPEACLHPPLQYQLGKDIASHAIEVDKQIFIATHSADFLLGCIETSQKINIIRFGYDEVNNKSSAHLISQDYLISLMKNPVIRHTNFLTALFYKYAIVSEADGDRVFYSEINRRLVSHGHGIDSCLFINSPNGKGALKHFCDGLIKFRMPYVVIVDFDIINDGLTKLLRPSGLKEDHMQAINKSVTDIKTYCTNNSISIKKGGLTKINDEDVRIIAIELIEKLKNYGIFIVPCGELEYWLEECNVSSANKNTWLEQIFDKIGQSSEDTNFVYPNLDNDVWKFMEDIAKWLKNRQIQP